MDCKVLETPTLNRFQLPSPHEYSQHESLKVLSYIKGKEDKKVT